MCALPILSKKVEMRVPTEPPKFGVRELKQLIPAHCWKRSWVTSSKYLVLDILGVATLYYLSTFIPLFPIYLQYVLWPAYWVLQGGVMTGLWVVAHECGHRAFAESNLINDSVGLVVHSFLLVPYHAWRISHAKHHKSTGNMELDEVFIPHKSSDYFKSTKAKYEPPSPFLIVTEGIVFFLFGWIVYLTTHTTGRDYGRYTNHFQPTSPLFTSKDYNAIVISNVGIATMISLLVTSSVYISFSWMFFSYFVPYLIVNFWLLLYTYLHHTHVSLPHYANGEWDWLRGALATVDRDYGFLWNTLHHNIGNTHVLHHLFSKIPHYHAMEATNAIKPLLGDYYFSSDESILTSLYSTMKECRFVDDAPGNKILWFHDRPIPACTSQQQ